MAAKQGNTSRRTPASSRRPKSRPVWQRSRLWFAAGSIGAAVLLLGLGVIGLLIVGFDLPGVVASVAPATGSPHRSWQAVVTIDDVNVRADASTDSVVIETATVGQQVTVTGAPNGQFLPVMIDGRLGWIAADYLGRESVLDAPAGREADSIVIADHLIPSELSDALEPVAQDELAKVDTVPTGAPTEVELLVEMPVDVMQAAPTDEAAALETSPVVGLTEAPLPPSEEDAGPTREAVSEQAGPAGHGGERWIDVDRTTAMVTLYVGDSSLASFRGKIGRDPSADGFYSTAVGTYHVYSMQEGLSSTPFVDDVYLSDWVGFDPERKNGFHSPVREADGRERLTQNPTTMGCVRLNSNDAVALFDFAYVGMRVEIHD